MYVNSIFGYKTIADESRYIINELELLVAFYAIRVLRSTNETSVDLYLDSSTSVWSTSTVGHDQNSFATLQLLLLIGANLKH